MLDLRQCENARMRYRYCVMLLGYSRTAVSCLLGDVRDVVRCRVVVSCCMMLYDAVDNIDVVYDAVDDMTLWMMI